MRKNDLLRIGKALWALIALTVMPLPAAALPTTSFGAATIFKSRNDLDPVGLAAVSPATDHLFIGGDGIDNGGFTLTTDATAGVQLGLRAGERFNTNFLPNNGAGTYFADPGASPSGPSDPPGSAFATWNYYIHVDLGADLAPLVPSGDVFGPGPLTRGGTVDSVLLDVDFDPGAGVQFVTVDVYAQAIALGGATAPLLIQDSQNLAFDFWGLLGAPPFDIDAEGVYTIRLRALAGAIEVASAEIDVVVGSPEKLIVSYGVQGGEPNLETLGGTAVAPEDTVNVDDATLIMAALPSNEDLDAFHVLDDGRVLFSTTTLVFVGGTSFGPADIVEFDGANYDVFFDGSLVSSVSPNIDALSVLPNGNLLVSTTLSSTIYGFSFANGDVVEIDPVAESASLFMGLDEAALFTGANQDIDALHLDAASGNLLLSLKIAGIGTVGGLPYDSAIADAFELDASNAFAGSLFLDGTGLYDGSTRQLDAIYLPEPTTAAGLIAGIGLLLGLRRDPAWMGPRTGRSD